MKKKALHFHVVTLFKESVDSYIEESILGRARGEGKIKITYYNPREFADKKVAYIDGKPYGGGPGMVIQALPVVKAVEKALRGKTRAKVIMFSPSGKQFTNEYAQKLARSEKDIVLIAGRYEGIDARAKKILGAEEVSIGPYVLTGGELPTAVVIDAISRQIEGVLGNFDSREEARISSPDVYTRPETLVYKNKKYTVPKVLLSGDRRKIEEWKKERRSRQK